MKHMKFTYYWYVKNNYINIFNFSMFFNHSKKSVHLQNDLFKHFFHLLHTISKNFVFLLLWPLN